MKIGTFIKSVPIEMVKLDGEEFERADLACALEQLEETNPKDEYGYYGVKDYQLDCSSDTIEKLEKLGYVVSYTGERQSHCYKKSPETFDKLIGKLRELGLM